MGRMLGKEHMEQQSSETSSVDLEQSRQEQEIENFKEELPLPTFATLSQDKDKDFKSSKIAATEESTTYAPVQQQQHQKQQVGGRNYLTSHEQSEDKYFTEMRLNLSKKTEGTTAVPPVMSSPMEQYLDANIKNNNANLPQQQEPQQKDFLMIVDLQE